MTIASRHVRCAATLVCAAALATAHPAPAQDKMPAAEGLFREGRELMEKGDLTAGCAKLAESQRLDPSAGTLLNLARCHEKQGKVASAWAEYLAAKRLGLSQNRGNIAEEAEKRAGELEPRVSYVKIVLSEKVAGIGASIDEVKLEAGALDAKIPVDPGERTISVYAPGRRPATMKVTVGADHEMQTVSVPRLEVAPEPPPPAASAPAGPPEGRSVLPFVVGGAGIAFLGVGTVFSFMAKSAYDDASSACPSHAGCTQSAMDLHDKAVLRANIANVGIGLGIVGIGVGTVLLLTQPRAPEKAQPRTATGWSSLRLDPFASPAGGGLSLAGVTQ